MSWGGGEIKVGQKFSYCEVAKMKRVLIHDHSSSDI